MVLQLGASEVLSQAGLVILGPENTPQIITNSLSSEFWEGVSFAKHML